MLKYSKFGETKVNPNQLVNKMFSCLNESQTPYRYFTQLHFLIIGHVFKENKHVKMTSSWKGYT